MLILKKKRRHYNKLTPQSRKNKKYLASYVKGTLQNTTKKKNTRYYESFIAQQQQEHTSHIPIQIKMSNSKKKNTPKKNNHLLRLMCSKETTNNIQKSHKHTSKTTFLIT